MLKRVGVSGDASATASSSTSPATQPTWQGSWLAGPITETTHSKLMVDGVRALHEVRCTFTFSGTDTSVSPTPPAVSMTSDVVLRATSTVLREEGRFVLLNGDTERDTHGNEISVSAVAHLRAA